MYLQYKGRQKRKTPRDTTIGSQAKAEEFNKRLSRKSTSDTINITVDQAISRDGKVLLDGRYNLIPMIKKIVTKLQTHGVSITIFSLVVLRLIIVLTKGFGNLKKTKIT